MAKPPQVIAFLLAVIAVMGGVYLADQAGWINLTPGDTPRANQLWEVVILSTSDTDRTEVGENIPDTHTLTWELSDANMDGLGDVNLDVRVINMNAGSVDEIWPLRADLTFVSIVAANSYIVNVTDLNSRFAVTWSLTESGSPTLTQIGQYAISNDWKTGNSDALNIDLEMSVTNCALITSSLPGKLEFSVGGVKLTVNLVESV